MEAGTSSSPPPHAPAPPGHGGGVQDDGGPARALARHEQPLSEPDIEQGGVGDQMVALLLEPGVAEHRQDGHYEQQHLHHGPAHLGAGAGGGPAPPSLSGMLHTDMGVLMYSQYAVCYV